MTLVANLDYFAENLESQVEITVYLKDGATQADIDSVSHRLQALPDVKSVTFTDKNQAMDILKERMKDQPGILDALEGKNPLPSSFEVTFTEPEAVRRTADIVADYPEVEGTHYGQEIIEQLFQITTIIRWGGIALIVFLTLAMLFIISNTIRLTVFARRKEIAIMKYVGATNWFIRWPFLLEGLFLGFIGGIIATSPLSVLRLCCYGHSPVPGLLTDGQRLSLYVPHGRLLLIISMVIGAIGSTISLKRYMKV